MLNRTPASIEYYSDFPTPYTPLQATATTSTYVDSSSGLEDERGFLALGKLDSPKLTTAQLHLCGVTVVRHDTRAEENLPAPHPPNRRDHRTERHQTIAPKHLHRCLGGNLPKNAEMGHHENAIDGKLSDAERFKGVNHHESSLFAARRVTEHATAPNDEV
jgi:hypothetical protein